MKRRSGVSVCAIICIALASVLSGCPRPPDDRTVDACAERVECGECVNQPQCGWCMSGGEGVCIANTGETNPDVAPPSCDGDRTWHFLIRDDPALPEGAPYCPTVAAPEETSGDESERAARSELTEQEAS